MVKPFMLTMMEARSSSVTGDTRPRIQLPSLQPRLSQINFADTQSRLTIQTDGINETFLQSESNRMAGRATIATQRVASELRRYSAISETKITEDSQKWTGLKRKSVGEIREENLQSQIQKYEDRVEKYVGSKSKMS